MRSILIALVCISCVTIGSQAQNKKKNKAQKSVVVFTVNKKPVTSDEFIYLYKKNHQNKAEDFTEQKIQEYLDLFINFKLKVEEARHRGLDTTAAFIREYNSYKDELRKPYLPDSKLTDSLVKLTYKRMTEEVRASHILINVTPEASPADTLKAYNNIMDIRNKALAGENFANLAASFSEDPSAKVNNGDLGFFTALQMVYPFESAAYTTSVGKVSNPVRTKFGYHLVQVTARQPARGEVEVAHIMIRTGESKDNEKAKNIIFDLYDQLNKGASWDELCKQYSEDPGSKENGGKLRPFGTGAMASVPAFESAAFALQKPGELSDPFQTQYGWHIVKLEKKLPLQSFDEMAATLKTKVARDERVQISKQALQAKLRKEYAFVESPQVKEKVFSLADSTLKQGKWKAPSFAAEKETLFTLKKNAYTAKAFIAYVEKNQHASAQAPNKLIEQLYNNYVEASIARLLEDNLIANNPEYKMLLNEYYEGILLFEIMEKEVWNKATEDSIGQHKYFDAHASTYQAKERVDATVYSSGDKDFSSLLKAELKKVDSTELAMYLQTKKIKTESGRFEKEEKAILGKITWSKGEYAVENNGLYYLVVVNDIVPPGGKTFDEARAAVISDYQNSLEQSWVDQLKVKYPVKINEKGKKYTVEQLQKK